MLLGIKLFTSKIMQKVLTLENTICDNMQEKLFEPT